MSVGRALRVGALLAVRWCGVALQLALNVLLGRTVGAEGTGVFAVAWAKKDMPNAIARR